MMEQDDERSIEGAAGDPWFIVSDDDMHRIARSLAVAHGYAQLLRRRVQKNPPAGSDDLEGTLMKLEEATRRMVDDLQRIVTTRSHARGDGESS